MTIMWTNQRGTVLPVTLMIVLLLTSLAVAVTSLGMLEPADRGQPE